MGKSYGLGFGSGSIIDIGGGAIEYRQTGMIFSAFEINVADVTGFSVRRPTKEDKKNGASSLRQVMVIQGGGTELASCPMNHGTAEKIEAWIKSHPMFRGNGAPATSTAAPVADAPPPAVNIADQLA